MGSTRSAGCGGSQGIGPTVRTLVPSARTGPLPGCSIVAQEFPADTVTIVNETVTEPDRSAAERIELGEALSDASLARRRRELDELLMVIADEVARDGGSIRLGQVDLPAGRIEVVLGDACGSCSLTGGTLEDGVKRILRQRLDWVVEVVGSVDQNPSVAGRGAWRPKS